MEEKIKKLEERIKALEEPNFFSDKFIDLLVASGFLKLDSIIEYTSQADPNLRNRDLFVQTGENMSIIYSIPGEYVKEMTANPSTDEIVSNNHGLPNDAQVLLFSTGSLPSPLLAMNPYYVVSSTLNSFKVSLTLGGTPEDITDTGTGTHYWRFFT